ncbi:MAG: hypothetical protein Q9168_003916 [Polycauliona sp. 1 TL-2023]
MAYHPSKKSQNSSPANIAMDAYITSLAPDWSSTTTWMRTRTPMANARSKLQSLGELLGSRLEYLNREKPDEEADGLYKEMGEVFEKVNRWLVEMKKNFDLADFNAWLNFNPDPQRKNHSKTQAFKDLLTVRISTFTSLGMKETAAIFQKVFDQVEKWEKQMRDKKFWEEWMEVTTALTIPSPTQGTASKSIQKANKAKDMDAFEFYFNSPENLLLDSDTAFDFNTGPPQNSASKDPIAAFKDLLTAQTKVFESLGLKEAAQDIQKALVSVKEWEKQVYKLTLAEILRESKEEDWDIFFDLFNDVQVE